MKQWVLSLMSGVLLLLCWVGCSDDSATGPTNQTIIVSRDTLTDTSKVNLDSNTIIGKIFLDSIRSGRKDTLIPVDSSNKNIVNLQTTLYDTLYRAIAKVESTVVRKEITIKSVIDSFNVTNNLHNYYTLDTIAMDTFSKISIRFIDTPSVKKLISTDSSNITKKQYYLGYLLATTGNDYIGNAGVGVLSLNDQVTVTNTSTMTLKPQNKVFSYDGSAYILESSGLNNGVNKISRFGGQTITPSAVVYQKTLSPGVDIHDIAFASPTKAYITQSADSILLVINPLTGDVTNSVNLAPFGNTIPGSRPVPYMGDAMVIKDNVYVICKRLKASGEVDSIIGGIVVVISTKADTVVDTIHLTMKNPVAMDTAGGYLYVSSTGSWVSMTDGGIEKIKLKSDTDSLWIVEKVISEARVQGNITQICLVSPTKGYMLVTKSTSATAVKSVVEFNPSDNTGAIGFTLNNIDDASGGFLYDGIYLYIGDRSATRSGVIVIDPKDNRRIAGPLKFGAEAPTSIAVLVTPRK